ncbi:hypothetical protein PGQ11_002156 [Apiospora arundinis]|uniref:Uncharacterized protein n=1 Tax=Apiospora arundinis TaxID=335852 RepID=A0ABR2JIW2_9PEZI
MVLHAGLVYWRLLGPYGIKVNQQVFLMLYIPLHVFYSALKMLHDLGMGMGMGWNDVSRAPCPLCPPTVLQYVMILDASKALDPSPANEKALPFSPPYESGVSSIIERMFV